MHTRCTNSRWSYPDGGWDWLGLCLCGILLLFFGGSQAEVAQNFVYNNALFSKNCSDVPKLLTINHKRAYEIPTHSSIPIPSSHYYKLTCTFPLLPLSIIIQSVG